MRLPQVNSQLVELADILATAMQGDDVPEIVTRTPLYHRPFSLPVHARARTLCTRADTLAHSMLARIRTRTRTACMRECTRDHKPRQHAVIRASYSCAR